MWLLSELNDAFLRSQAERPVHPNYNHGPYQHCNDKCVASYQKNIPTSHGEHSQQSISKTWVFWSKHVSEICFKAKKIIGLIYRQYYQHSNTDTLKQLCISSVWPHLEYMGSSPAKRCQQTGESQLNSFFSCRSKSTIIASVTGLTGK